MKQATIRINAHESVIVTETDAGVALEMHAFGLCLARRSLTKDQAWQLSDALGFTALDAPRCTGNCNQGRNCTCRVPA